MKEVLWAQQEVLRMPKLYRVDSFSVIEFFAELTFKNLFHFYKIIQKTESKNLFNYLNQTLISMQHFCIKWSIQIKFFNYISQNIFNFWIDIETNSAFFIFIKLGYYICQISNFLSL